MIKDHAEEITRLYAEHFTTKQPTGHWRNGNERSERPGLSNEEIITRAISARNGAKFEKLWRGDIGHYESHSEADLALLSMLAFWTRDEEQLEALFSGSGLVTPKWSHRPDYRRRTISKALAGLTETYSAPGELPSGSLSNDREVEPASPSPSLIRKEGRGRRLKAVQFSEIPPPGKRRYLVEGLVPSPHVTLMHGDGGVAKSLLALSLAVAVAGGSKEWLGREIESCPVLYLDFELDGEEQVRRVHQLCRGEGRSESPSQVYYMSALGHSAREAFDAALAECEEHGVKLLILDSLGPALQGDAEAARDVIGFFQRVIEPFRALGVSVLVIDHQSRLQDGQSYQNKSAFGSVYKTNLARSVIQVQATDRSEGTLTVRLRQKKHNFGPPSSPFGAKLTFTEEEVNLEAVELKATDLAEEGTIGAKDRVKLVLEDGPAYPQEIAEVTGLAEKTVKNKITDLRKEGIVEDTGETQDRIHRVRLASQRPSPIRDGDEDANREDVA